jgi:GT2 family glycosyltransferase
VTRAGVRLAGAAWLSDSTLVIAGRFERAGDRIEKASLVYERSTINLQVRWSTYPHTESNTPKSVAPWLIVARGNGSIRRGSAFELALSGAVRSWHLDVRTVAAALTDLKTLIRDQFAAVDADQRNFIVDFLALTATEAVSHDSADRLRVSRSLKLARDMLRERSPICELSPNRIEGLSVEAMLALDETSFYVEGWMCDIESAAVRLTAVSPEGARTEILSKLFRYDRPDAAEFFRAAIGAQASAKYGFICYFKITTPSLLPVGWVLEMETAAGTVMEAVAPPTITKYSQITADLLGDIVHDVGANQELHRLHISPALLALQSQLSGRVCVSDTRAFGRQVPNPDVSILVPLYGRIDLLEHQLAHFADDADLRTAELIYVLDSPELGKELLGMAERLFRLYRLPLRVVVLSESAGFSTANNIAASAARGRLLLFLNSDVLPQTPGWLSRMLEFHKSLERPGAVGPKLIYEDDSLQHAGLYFERSQESQVWTNEHYYKGLHSDLPAANVTRPVPAVTGACLLIDARLYASVGGMSGVYIQGDYEDSDLCLRLSQAGRENWYFPGSVLYHLEGQSYPTASRRLNTEYNRWLFNSLWHDAIEAASERYDSHGIAPDPNRLPSPDTTLEIRPLVASGQKSRQSKDRNGTSTRALRSPR